MFKFNFNFEEDAQELNRSILDSQYDYKETSHDPATVIKPPKLTASSPEDLLENLPPVISYSPLRIPLSGGGYLTLLRRDLFDARFQLISESFTVEASDDLRFIDAPSDLVPGVYEGGLKTWECSIDLASYLDTVTSILERPTCKVLEIGCGTAVPTLFLLHKIFSLPAINSYESPRRTFHLQDYNLVVFKLVTLPNIILTWYLSSASTFYHSQEDLPKPDLSEPGELTLTPELLSAFSKSLQDYKIDINFISGTWQDVDMWTKQTKNVYDLTLSSETIYRISSLPSLISLLQTASTRQPRLQEEDLSNEFSHSSLRQSESLCLIAAKVIYFGVGGGTDSFVKAITQLGGHCRIVFEKASGVNRQILQVIWDREGGKSS